MKIVTTAILGFLILFSGSATTTENPTGSISGFVYADEDSIPLGYANIVIIGTKLGAMSDSTGFFRIEHIPAGMHMVKVLMMGYHSLEVSDVVVRPDRETKQEYRIDPAFGLSNTAAARESPPEYSPPAVPMPHPTRRRSRPQETRTRRAARRWPWSRS